MSDATRIGVVHRLCGLLAVFNLQLIDAGDASRPHYHQGTLVGYTRGGPSHAGMVIDDSIEEQLRNGPVITITVLPNGVIRSTTVQDVKATPDIVWDLLLDFKNYPKFVEGIKSCDVYKKHWSLSGEKIICADYKLRVGTFHLQYFLEHVYEPLKSSMTWTLDYSRYSDVHDSVGYWHVAPHEGGARVFYATDSVLPSWIPGPIKSAFARIAMAKATEKLPRACVAAMAAKEQERGVRFVSFLKTSMPFTSPVSRMRMPPRMQQLFSKHGRAPSATQVVEVSNIKRIR